VIADVDFGFRLTHEDLRVKIKETFNAFDGSADVSHGEDVRHGTAVLGLAGGADNDRGIVGVAYEADLWAIQGDSGPGKQIEGDPWVNAINWAYQKNSGGKRKVLLIEVQTLGKGNIEMYRPVWQAIKDAIAADVVVCVAAGNGNLDAGKDHDGNRIEPTGSILVGATAFDEASNPRAKFSNWGPRITVSAPGDPKNDFTSSSEADNAYMRGFGGTSGAAPKVAGTIALMLEVNPALRPDEIKDILSMTGASFTTAEADKPIGVFLNAGAAVKEAKRRAS
jgi:subtilisin family serine protease